MFPNGYFSKVYFTGNYWPPVSVVIHVIQVAAANIFRHVKTKVFFAKRETK